MALAKFPDRMTGNKRREIINHLKAGTSLSGSATFIPAPVAVELIDELEHSVRIPDANDVLFAVARCERYAVAECAATGDPFRAAVAAQEKHASRRYLLSLVGLRSFSHTEASCQFAPAEELSMELLRKYMGPWLPVDPLPEDESDMLNSVGAMFAAVSKQVTAVNAAALAGELQALRNHVEHCKRPGIDDAALQRANAVLADFSRSAAGTTT
jgi:hypothetical protein